MSKISLEQFIGKFADELSIDVAVLSQQKLTEIGEYDSMAKINISLLIEELFGFQIDYDVLNSTETIQALYENCLASATL